MRFVVAILCATSLLAADEQATSNLVTSKSTPTASAPMFGTGSWFRTSFKTPEPPRIELKSPVRLNDFVVDAKLDLSLRSYLDLVLANFTDITVERVTLETSRNAVLRAYAIFDPVLLASFNATRNEVPLTQRLDVLGTAGPAVLDKGAFLVSSLDQPARFTYTQTLPTGTQYNVGFNASKSSTNSRNQLYNPLVRSSINFNFAQPLLRNRGSYFTKMPVSIARSRLRADEYNTEDRILQLVAQAENAYWDVILARENLRVSEQALALADASLKRAQKELELGAISQLEIYQPEAQYKNFEILVTQARYGLTQAEDVLRRYIGADLDPNIRNLPINLTESITPPAQVNIDKEASVETALRLRPDLKRRRQLIDVDDLTINSTANLLKPDFALTGQYGSSGQGIFWNDTNGYLPGGIGNAFSQMFSFGFPVYGFGLRLTLPIRDRRAAADYADAVVTKRVDLLRVRSAEQTARQEVLNAISRVESSRASVELARVALDLAQKRVEADQKRYDLGTITLFFLLDSQNALTQAQSALVNQSVNYRKNLVTLQRLTGELLAERGIRIQ